MVGIWLSETQQAAPARSVIGSTTVLPSDGLILVDASGGNATVTFPASSTIDHLIFTVVKIDSSGNTVTLAKNAADTLSNGGANIVLSARGESQQIQASAATSRLVLI